MSSSTCEHRKRYIDLCGQAISGGRLSMFRDRCGGGRQILPPFCVHLNVAFQDDSKMLGPISRSRGWCQRTDVGKRPPASSATNRVLSCRSVAQERVSAVAQSEEAELSRRRADCAKAKAGGGAGVQGVKGRDRGHGSRPGPGEGNDPVSRLEHRLEVQGGSRPGSGGEGESTARIRRNIQFLEDCDW